MPISYKLLSPEENTFSNIMIDVTHRCNMSCHNCYLPNRQIPDMDKEKLLETMERLPNRVFARIIGAEPTMRKDLPEIISRLKKQGHRVSLTTNGLKLADKNYLQELKSAGLRLVLLSMNGADEDDVYMAIDNMKCAALKMKALENLIDLNMIVNTGTIISKGCNEKTLTRQIQIFESYKLKVPPVLRFRTIGLIGRNQGSEHVYGYQEFIDFICKELDISQSYISENKVDVLNNTSGISFAYKNVIVRLVDWTPNHDGVPDAGNDRRGRVTENWMIAPFFEHVKDNEFAY